MNPRTAIATGALLAIVVLVVNGFLQAVQR